jgi:hypothetical protein
MAKAGNYVQDLRLAKGFHREARFLRIRRKYGSDGIFAVLMLWDWVAEQFPTSGRLEDMELEDIADVCCISPADAGPFVEDLMYNDWFLSRDEEGYFLPNWAEEQPYVAGAGVRAEKARRAAEARWGKGAGADDPARHEAEQPSGMPGACPEHARSNADGMQTQCDSNAPIPIPSKKNKNPPTPRRGAQADQTGEGLKAEEVLALFREVLPELPQPRAVTDKLRRELRARVRADAKRRNLEWWRWFFGLVREYPYPMGEVADWQATLGWLLGRTNMDKILGGEYQARADLERRRDEGEQRPQTRGLSLEEFERMQAGASMTPG